MTAVFEHQHATGFWKPSIAEVFPKFFVDGNFEDGEVKNELQQIQAEKGFDLEQVYLTLVALFVFTEEFALREDEWKLIAKKAKKWLKGVGVEQPESLVRMFSTIHIIF